MRISDWSSDVCSSDLFAGVARRIVHRGHAGALLGSRILQQRAVDLHRQVPRQQLFENGLLVRLVFIDRTAQIRRRRRLVRGGDRKSVVEGKGGSVRVDRGGRRIIKKKNTKHQN